MFLRATIRKKNGKEHRYWSIVENKRITGGKVRQRRRKSPRLLRFPSRPCSADL
jgi:hypothetical protein